MWQFPDEQAHFGHVAYLAEGGPLPMGRTNDLNQEIAISEQRLGTYRNKYGNNSFTYNPGFNLEYSQTVTGIYEDEIKNLPPELRKEYKWLVFINKRYPYQQCNAVTSYNCLFFYINCITFNFLSCSFFQVFILTIPRCLFCRVRNRYTLWLGASRIYATQNEK